MLGRPCSNMIYKLYIYLRLLDNFMVKLSCIIFALSITFYNYSRTSISIFCKLDNAWSRCMSTFVVHHKRFQALYEVPKSPIVFNDFLVSLTDLEALSVVLLLCSSNLNDEEENDILIYTYIWYMCFILFSSSSSEEDNSELGFVLSQSDIISCLCWKMLKLQQ